MALLYFEEFTKKFADTSVHEGKTRKAHSGFEPGPSRSGVRRANHCATDETMLNPTNNTSSFLIIAN
jgi:hypothetical protein